MDNSKKVVISALVFLGLGSAAWLILSHLFSILIAAVAGIAFSELWDAAKAWVVAHKASEAAAVLTLQADAAKLPGALAGAASGAITALQGALDAPKT